MSERINVHSRDFHQYNDARFANMTDLRRGGFLTPGGAYLGIAPDDKTPMFYNGDGHILTCAPPGYGKTTGIILPNLLTYNRGSIVVTDPKGVLTAITRRQREEKFGNKIVVINPWREEIADKEGGSLGTDLGDTGYNPLRTLRPDDPNIIDEAETIFSIICPVPPKLTGVDKFFAQSARTVLIASAIFLTRTEGEVTLPRLYNFIRTTKDGWAAICADMMEHKGLDLSGYAGEILAHMDSQNQWAGVLSSMNQSTDIYNPGKKLGEHVSRDEFDPADLKRENITVYIVVPSHRREANSHWLGLVIANIAEAVGKPGKSSSVMLIAEEFANLGYLPSIPSAMAEYREAGLKVHLIIQNMGQLTATYGKDEANNLIKLCNIRQFFGISDAELARDLEHQIGTYTTLEQSYYEGIIMNHGTIQTHDRHCVKLAPQQDILNMPDDEQLILSAGETPPILGYIRGYYQDPKLDRIADPNPMDKKRTEEERKAQYYQPVKPKVRENPVKSYIATMLYPVEAILTMIGPLCYFGFVFVWLMIFISLFGFKDYWPFVAMGVGYHTYRIYVRDFSAHRWQHEKHSAVRQPSMRKIISVQKGNIPYS